MPRNRSGGDDVGFGSDSFLDIIANIVGILIILIVVAGVRVSQAPLAGIAQPVATVAEPQVPVPVPAIPDPTVPARAEVAVTTPSNPLLLPDAALPTDRDTLPGPAVVPDIVLDRYIPQPPEPIDPDPELEQRIRELRGTVASLEDRFSETRSSYRSLLDGTQAARTKLAEAERMLDEHLRRVATTAEEVDQLEKTVERSAERIVDLRQQIEEAEREQPAETLRHDTTAVAKVVDGHELHFRLAGGRVAAVPMGELMEAIEDRIRNHISWLIKYKTSKGVAGPIDGFEMHYVLARVGQKIIVAYAEVVVTEEAVAETFEEAMQPGSRFRRTVGRSHADTALTFWTYPDSFEIFRQLQAVAHANDYKVAGRPLSAGMPIASSPNGSRSSGQ